MNKLKLRNNSDLIFVVGINGIVLLLAGLFIPSLSLAISFMLGIFTFYLAYSVPTKNSFWKEIRLVFLIIGSSTVGNLLLWVSCIFFKSAVCQTKAFNGQVIGYYAAPFLASLFLWLTSRLPIILKNRRRK
jgi:hypothetical protein